MEIDVANRHICQNTEDQSFWTLITFDTKIVPINTIYIVLNERAVLVNLSFLWVCFALDQKWQFLHNWYMGIFNRLPIYALITCWLSSLVMMLNCARHKKEYESRWIIQFSNSLLFCGNFLSGDFVPNLQTRLYDKLMKHNNFRL